MAKAKRRLVVVGFSDRLQAWLAWTSRGLHIVQNIPPVLDTDRAYRGVEVVR